VIVDLSDLVFLGISYKLVITPKSNWTYGIYIYIELVHGDLQLVRPSWGKHEFSQATNRGAHPINYRWLVVLTQKKLINWNHLPKDETQHIFQARVIPVIPMSCEY
jgi:hypothetical protein